LVIGPACAGIYYETHNKTFKYCYWTFKGIGSCMKVVWDFYFDWGLFRRTKKESPLFLRDKITYPRWFYYIAMLYDLFALFFWVVVIKYYYSMVGEHHELNVPELQFFDNVMWITWLELIVVSVRRTIWVLIRLENEFFNNFESFRDIQTVPPIKKEK